MFVFIVGTAGLHKFSCIKILAALILLTVINSERVHYGINYAALD